MNRIGIFGGTFDPIHLGHLEVALCVRAVLELDLVELVVAHKPWQKLAGTDVQTAPMVSALHRFAMVQAAVADVAGLAACDMEIERGGLTYTVDTLEEFCARDATSVLFLIVGSDAAAQMHTWQRYSEIERLATVVVIDRPGSVGQRPLLQHQLVRCPMVDISSSKVRALIAAGESLAEFMPPAALDYCRQHRLYGC